MIRRKPTPFWAFGLKWVDDSGRIGKSKGLLSPPLVDARTPLMVSHWLSFGEDKNLLTKAGRDDGRWDGRQLEMAQNAGDHLFMRDSSNDPQ